MNPLLLLWQLPQVILGAILWIIFKISGKIIDAPNGVYRIKIPARVFPGISLGPFIFISWDLYNFFVCAHERGHSRQSLFLGPLYLLIIGLPSIIGNIVWRVAKLPPYKYYQLPWEAWADDLGGVDL